MMAMIIHLPEMMLDEVPKKKCNLEVKFCLKKAANHFGGVNAKGEFLIGMDMTTDFTFISLCDEPTSVKEALSNDKANIALVRLLLVLAATEAWDGDQMEVKTTFLHGELKASQSIQGSLKSVGAIKFTLV